MSKVVFPSFSGDHYQPYEIRQLVSALELRFLSLESEGQALFDTTNNGLDNRYSQLGHTHSESEITDLQAYLTSITGESIFDLSDVSGTAVLNDTLVWNGTAFTPQPASAVSIALDDLTDVSIPVPLDGEVLTYDSGTGVWIAASSAGLTSFVDLSDTDLSGQAKYDLVYNADGSEWQNTAGQLIWNPDFDYLQLANAHSINWLDSGFITQELLVFEEAAGASSDPLGAEVVLLLSSQGRNDGDTALIDRSSFAHAVSFGGSGDHSSDQAKNNPTSLDVRAEDDHITVPDDAAFDLAGGDWTMEFWVYPTIDAFSHGCLEKDSFTANERSFEVSFTSSNLTFEYTTNGITNLFQIIGTVSGINQWHYLVVQRTGTLVESYVNGTLQGASFNVGTDVIFDGIGDIIVGAQITGGSSFIAGDNYMDDVRITVGTARYSGPTMTVPTAPAADPAPLAETFVVGDSAFSTRIDGLTTNITSVETDIDGFTDMHGDLTLDLAAAANWLDAGSTSKEMLALKDGVGTDADFSSVVLLLPFEGDDTDTDTTDLSLSAHSPITFGGTAQIDTAQFNNQGSSLLLDGNSDWLLLPDSNDWTFFADDFTIDIAIRFNVVTTCWFISHYEASQVDRAWTFGYDTTAGLRFVYNEDGATNIFVDRSWTASINTWYQLRVSRIGPNLYLFIDGVLQGAADNIGTLSIFNSTHELTIGGLGNTIAPTQLFNGWIDDLRITKGVGRSSTTFTLPTTEWGSSLAGFIMGNSAHPSVIFGTDLQVFPATTFQSSVDIFSTLDVDGNATFGSDVLIEGPNQVGSTLFTHDDTDFFTTFTNTTLWNISAVTIDIKEPASGIKTLTIDGGLDGSATVPLIHWYDTGTNIDRRLIKISEDGGVTEPDGFYIDIDSSPGNPNNRIIIGSTSAHGDVVAFHQGGILQVVGGGSLRIQDTGNTDWADFIHDGTDFNQAFTNTRTWAISGLDLIAATGNEIAMTLDYTVNKASSGDDTGLIINKTDTLSQGTSLLLDLKTDGVTKFSWSANPTFTMYDDSGVDSAAFNHDGTDFITTFTTTIDWDVLGLSGEMFVDADMRVSGDFTTEGTLTSINTNDLNIADNLIVLNSDAVNPPTEDAGIEIFRGGVVNDVSVLWDETADVWTLSNDGITWFEIITTDSSVAEVNDLSAAVTWTTENRVLTDINTATPPTIEAVTGNFEIMDNDATDTLGVFGFNGDNDLVAKNFMRGGFLEGEYTQADGTAIDAYRFFPNGDFVIYREGLLHLQGTITGLEVRNAGGTNTSVTGKDDIGTVLWTMGTPVSGAYSFVSSVNEQPIRFMATTTGSVQVIHFEGDPDGTTFVRSQVNLQLQVSGTDKALLATGGGGVSLYWNNLSTILTDNPANGGCFIDNDLTSGTSGKERVLSEADLEAGQPRLRYEFHSTITAADPGAGFIRYNNATPASVTELYLNDTSEHGLNSDRVLNNLADGDILTLGNEVDPADYLVVSVNGAPTDNTGWWTIPVTIIHSGTLPTVFQNLNIDVQWFSQVVAGGSPFATPLVITGDINTATPPTTEAVTARLLATDLAGDDDLFALGFEGDNNLILRSFMHSSTGGFELILENSAGAEANPIDIIGGSNVFMDFQSSSGALGVSATSNILWDTTNAELRRSGNRRIRTASDGMELHGDLSNDPTSGGTQDTHITFMNDIAQVCGDIDWLATTDMHIINRTHGGGFVFRMEDASGGTEVDALTFTEDAGQVLVAQETEVGMTAFATGGQTSATQISSSHSVFSTVATLADSSKLPEVFLVGTKCLIKNDGAADMDVFPFLGDDLGAGTNTAVSVVAGTGALFVATVADATWTQMY